MFRLFLLESCLSYLIFYDKKILSPYVRRES